MKNLTVEKNDKGIMTVTIDCPDSKVNKVIQRPARSRYPACSTTWKRTLQSKGSSS